jgi:ABC-type uncharacterized transport system permease subunit
VKRAPLLSLVFVLGGLVFALSLVSLAFGEAPRATLARALVGSWGTPYGVGQVLFKATPLLYSGLAFHVALRAGLFNIGAEGQLLAASLAAGFVASRVPAGLPALVAVPLVLAAASSAGGLAALVPGLMRARLGVSEVITCILLGRVLDVLAPWLLGSVLGAVALRTPEAPASARLPRLSTVVPALEGSAVSVAFPLALVVVVATVVLLPRSRAGREMRFVGLASGPCEAEGIGVARRRLEAMLLSGALVGLATSATVLGYKGYYELGLGAGAGFSGIAVALLSRGSAAGLVLAALFFGTLEQAGLSINATVPKDAMDLLEAAAVLLFSVAQTLEGRAASSPTGALSRPSEGRT